ncbi:MAG: hypothetical protein RSD36_16245 [Terrisporobacter sp.]
MLKQELKCKCNNCKKVFQKDEVYIVENGEYICKSCQQKHNVKLADMDLLKRIGSEDCRS